MNWLVACFEPFGEAETNVSTQICDRLKARDWAGRVAFTAPLPVTFAGAWVTLARELERHPGVDGVLTFGQAAGRRQLDLECLALNFVDTDVPDNAGLVPPRGRLADGPDVRWCPIEWTALAPDVAAARSYSAGTYVCNALFYASLGWAAASPKRRAAFVHVPALATQTEFAHLPRLDDDVAVATATRILEFLVEQ